MRESDRVIEIEGEKESDWETEIKRENSGGNREREIK